MRYNLVASALVAASMMCGVLAQSGADCAESGGNWYCQAVQKIAYSGFGKSGQYKKVTNMYPSCQQSDQSYSGPLSPFDEEVSMHFRGPMVINQVAVYTPSSSSSKAKARRTVHERRHGHAGFHKRNKEIREMQERQIGATVTATINGETVHWINEYGGPGGSPSTSAAAASTPSSAAGSGDAGFIGAAVDSVEAAAAPTTSSSADSATSSSSTASTPVASGDWVRSAYYKQDSQTAQGMVFLNNMGGSASGVFDNTYGNSLAYASPDGSSAASSPQVSNGTLDSNKEVIIFSDQKCNGDCGYVRDGTVAYHGFDGAEKLFLFEFSMPDDGTTGWNMNMPSGWFLNAQIPRTAQYASCSCWESGCGEFDWCEVLDSGNTKCKSTWHGNTPGGSSDYFDRPTSAPIKMAVLMTPSGINVQKLDDSQDFGTSMSKATINQLSSTSSESDGEKLLTTLFALGS
ncbi:hypothetical protein NA57DRAFT_75414 [Rhizodiscina lignyota]|uniref:glucan endo-1,3-beta-D-glucosidase n=1 Tax=Rhizodiscina lignyota TaxID=1504668 RepID=A0A9P4M6P8_9PEZI|nr:hypothetical protein NA57DRAFT_75414 [Rhizodiscina lignyota]